MAFSDGGSIGANGSSANNQSTLTLAVSQQCNVGELVVLVIADDNSGSGADADGSEVSSVAAGTNTFSKAKGWANNNAAAQAGAAVQIWYSVLTQQINNGANITITFANATLSDATGVTGRKFTTSGGTISVGATNQLSNDAADPGSLDATTSNREALRIRGIAAEVGNNTNLTATTNWTAWANGNSATTGTTAEMCARAEHRIFTGTGSASDPTYVSADCASAYVAFYEDFTLTPSLFNDSTDSFPAPTVGATYSITPSLYSDADDFFAPTVAFPGDSQDVTPSLFTDDDTFFAPTVASTYDLTPSLYTDDDTFFAPTVTPGAVNLTPALYSDSDSFFAPTVTPGAVDISPSLFADSDTFFSPTVTPGSVDITPSLYFDADTFFAPSVSAGTGDQDVSPSLYSDADTFFVPTVIAIYSLSPSLYSDPDTFFVPTVAPGAANVAPGLYVDPDTFFAPAVAHADITLTPSIFANLNAIYDPVVGGGSEIRVPTSGVGRFDGLGGQPTRGRPAVTTRSAPPRTSR